MPILILFSWPRMGKPAGFSKKIFEEVKQDSVVTIYLGALLSRTTIFKSFLRDSGMEILDDRMTCNQLLFKISIFILIVIILRQQDKPAAHEVSNRRLGDSAVHILGVVMEVLSEDLPTLFQVIFDRDLNASAHSLLTHSPYSNC